MRLRGGRCTLPGFIGGTEISGPRPVVETSESAASGTGRGADAGAVAGAVLVVVVAGVGDAAGVGVPAFAASASLAAFAALIASTSFSSWIVLSRCSGLDGAGGTYSTFPASGGSGAGVGSVPCPSNQAIGYATARYRKKPATQEKGRLRRNCGIVQVFYLKAGTGWEEIFK